MCICKQIYFDIACLNIWKDNAEIHELKEKFAENVKLRLTQLR